VREVSVAGEQIGRAVGQALRCLQFEDISVQALAAAERHSRRLLQAQAEAARLLCGRVPPALAGSASFGAEALPAEDWRQPPAKPVTQMTMQEGSVELF
jgi:methyl-accepting chemotaxis protein